MKPQTSTRESRIDAVALLTASLGEGTALYAHAGDPSLALAHQQALACLPAALDKLSPRLRQVVQLHYEEEMTFAEVGQQLEVSGVRAWQLHRDAIARLRCLFHGWGLTETQAARVTSH